MQLQTKKSLRKKSDKDFMAPGNVFFCIHSLVFKDLFMKMKSCKYFQTEAFGYYFCSERGRISPEMCEICPDCKLKSKYHNVKTVIDGIEFDSKKESTRWLELRILERDGMIKKLERQKRFEVVPKTENEKPVFYISDFVYEENGKLICEDVKSAATRKDKAYIIKRKLFKYLYKDYEFREV